MNKPECDYIKGIPPAIAIEQKVNTRNPRSTVGTSTEIYDYLRMLFARIGRTFSPVTGQEVKRHDVIDVINCMLSYPEGTRFALLTRLVIPQGRPVHEQLGVLIKQGFTRVEVDGNFVMIEDILSQGATCDERARLLVDRMTVADNGAAISRLTDSTETAFFEGHGECTLLFYTDKGTIEHNFSKRFEADGIEFEAPSDLMFNFNSPGGACPQCEGFGRIVGIDENLVIPNKTLSIYEDAVLCWRGDKMSAWKQAFIEACWTERLREMPLEMKMWDLCVRTGKFPNISETVKGQVTYETLIGAKNGSGATFQATDLYWPIPIDEIQRNPELTQNDGYAAK
jgi:excinuclease ABC subunit A